MYEYEVIFKKGRKTHRVKVKENGLIPAINAAISKHLTKYTDALGYEITGAAKIEK